MNLLISLQRAISSLNYSFSALISFLLSGDASGTVQTVDQPLLEEPDHDEVPPQGVILGFEAAERFREVPGAS